MRTNVNLQNPFQVGLGIRNILRILGSQGHKNQTENLGSAQQKKRMSYLLEAEETTVNGPSTLINLDSIFFKSRSRFQRFAAET